MQQFIIAGSVLAALAAAQSSSVAVNNVPTSFTAGQAGTFSVVAGSGPYTLQLRRGNSLNLSNVTYIDCSANTPTYSWTPSTSLESGSDYAIEIIQNGQINYSGQFSINGGAAPGSAPSQFPSPEGCPSSGASSSSSSSSSASASSTASGYGSATTMSTAARTGCVVTQISDGQPQAPTSCPVSTPAAASASYTPPKVSSVAGFNYGAVASPYVPQAGATGSPVASNSTVPTYSVPSAPTKSSGSSASSAPKASAPASAATQNYASFGLILAGVAAFAFLN